MKPSGSAVDELVAPAVSQPLPAGDLSALLHAIEQRELELEAQNLELRQATLPVPLTSEQYAQFFDSARVGCLDLDERGVIENINRPAATMLERTPAELRGRRFLQFIAKSDVEPFLKHIEQCGDTGENISCQLRLHAPRALIDVQMLCVPLRTRPERKSLRLVLADVSSIKQAEEKILHLAAFPAFNPNPVLEFAENGTLSWYNGAALDLARSLGYQNPAALVPKETPDLVAECLATRRSRLRQETVLGGRHLYWSYFPIFPSRVVHCYGTDITERLNLEARLGQSQKLDSVGQLAAGLAHDFNNILTIIQGYTSLLLSQRELSPEMSEPLRQIATATERAGNLTRQLMAFSRKQVMQPQTLDLNEIVQGVAVLLRRMLGETIQVQLDPAPNLPPIQADVGMLEQIVINLALNARDAMPNGGTLTFSTLSAEISHAQAEQNPECRPGTYVCLAVSDTGQGMEPEIMRRIFEPFFTTRQTGLGLGLSTVYGIVKQHQGWIEVSSQPGQGSIFRIFFPAAAAPVRIEAPATAPVGGSESVLVVEDEPVLRELVVRQLRKQGYRIISASSGAEALALWPDHAGEIDLLFTDMVMPDGITGRDLAETLLAQKPELKVIYTSGYSLDVVESEFALRKGANFLQKPYQPETLIQVIRSVLDGRKVTV